MILLKEMKGDEVKLQNNVIKVVGKNNSLQKRLSFFDGLCLVVGIIIGSGIFSSPGLSLYIAGSPGLSLISWTFAGLLVMLTSTCYMELGTALTNAGGDFEYLKVAYGDRAGFAFSFFNFFVSKTGSQAISKLVTI